MRRCSRWRACDRSRHAGQASHRCPNVATSNESPTSTICSASSRRRDPDRITFVEGPDEWCSDDPIATDRDYRWDGVHVYQRGANLILETDRPGAAGDPDVPLVSVRSYRRVDNLVTAG